jgi:tetratricopeptide (TPR) repeat protein
MGCATTKIELCSAGTREPRKGDWCFRRRSSGSFLVVSLWLSSAFLGHAVESELSRPARKAFQQAQDHYKQQPRDLEAAWQFGRAIFDLAEFATNKTERALLAEQGIAISRQAVALGTNSAPAHYYLAMNIGQLARTKSLGALRLIGQMEHEFNAAGELDPQIDFAGPDRNLGVLYRDAPSIGSVGSRSKARQRLQHAVELAPGYPENHLNLLETYLKWGERNNAERQLRALEQILPAARTQFTGPVWASSWVDWDPRIVKAQKSLERSNKALESPRGKS